MPIHKLFDVVVGQSVLRLVPFVDIPDLNAILYADNPNVFLEAGKIAQLLREEQTALCIDAANGGR